MSWDGQTAIGEVESLLADTSNKFVSDSQILAFLNDAQDYVARNAPPSLLRQLVTSESESVTSGLADYPGTFEICRLLDVRLDGYSCVIVPSGTGFNKGNYNFQKMDGNPLACFSVGSADSSTEKMEFYPQGASATYIFIRWPAALINDTSPKSDLEDFWKDVCVKYAYWKVRHMEGVPENTALAKELFDVAWQIAV